MIHVPRLRMCTRVQRGLPLVYARLLVVRRKADSVDTETAQTSQRNRGPVSPGAERLGGLRAQRDPAAGDGEGCSDALGAVWRARPAAQGETPLSPEEAMYLLPSYRAERGLD